METVKLRELIGFNKKQQEAFDLLDKIKYLLYGGAMGGGKSYWLRWTLVWYLSKLSLKYNITGICGALFCEDYPSLKDRQISKIGKEFPDWLGEMHADHKEYGKCYIARPEFGGWVILLRNLDDPSKYQSAEFAVIAIDELTKNQRETFDDLRNRLRWPGIDGLDLKFLAGTNPGSIGHAWVKKLWIDRDFEPEMEKRAHLFGYVQALATDNSYLDSEYLEELESLPEDKRKAFRDGNWDIFKGQYFSEFRREIHVIKPFSIPVYWRRYIWFDYGFGAPSAVYWVALDEVDKVYVYRELYGPGFTGIKLCEEIIRLTPEQEWNVISNWVGCHYIFHKKGESDISIAEQIEQTYNRIMRRSLILLKGEQDPGSRITGWNLMREYLKVYLDAKGEKTAKLQIFDNCNNLIRTLPALIYDANKVEDADKDSEDHGPEAIRIGLMSRPQKTSNTNPLKNILNRQTVQSGVSVIDVE